MALFNNNKKENVKFNNSNHCIAIFGLTSLTATRLAEELIKKGMNVYGFDILNKTNLNKFNNLQSYGEGRVKFFDLNSACHESFIPKQLSYIVIFNDGIKNTLTSKEFIDISKRVDDILILAATKKVKILLINDLNAIFANSENGNNSKTKIELYHYLEDLVNEYSTYKQVDARILNLAEVYGIGIEKEDSKLGELFRKAINEEKIKQKGNGLVFNYYIYIEDALSAVLKALTDKPNSMKTVSAAGGPAVSFLSISYILGAIANKEVTFEESGSTLQIEDSLKNIPKPILGWVPRTRLEEGFEEIYNSTVKELKNISSNNEQISEEAFLSENSKLRELKHESIQTNKDAELQNLVKQSIKESSLFDESKSISRLDELRKKYLKDIEGENVVYKEKIHYKFGVRKLLKWLIIIIIILIPILLIAVPIALGEYGNILYGDSFSKLKSDINSTNINSSDAQKVIQNVNLQQQNINTIGFFLHFIKNDSWENNSQNVLDEQKFLAIAVIDFSKNNYELAVQSINLGKPLASKADIIVYNKLYNLSLSSERINKLASLAQGKYILLIGTDLAKATILEINFYNNIVVQNKIDSTYNNLINKDIKGIDFLTESKNLFSDFPKGNPNGYKGILWVKENLDIKSIDLTNINKIYDLGNDLYNRGNLLYYISDSSLLSNFI